MSRTEELASQLARVTAATVARDVKLAAKLAAAAMFDQAVADCQLHGCYWLSSSPDPSPAETRLLVAARAAHRAHDQARRELAAARRRLDNAYRGLGRAVAP